MREFIIQTESRKDANFIQSLEKCLDRIREHYPKEKCLKLTPEIFITKTYREQTAEIEKILENRFGIEFRFKRKFLSVLDEELNSLPYIHVINPGIRTNVENFKAIKEDTEETLNQLLLKYNNNPEILEELMEEVNANDVIDYILRNNGLRININEHKVLNVPKGTYVYINFNILYLLYRSDYPLSNKEIIAILLHEIGHLFTTFHLYYRTSLKNTSILREIRELGKKKEVETKEVLTIILKHTNPKANIKDNSDIIATIKTFRELLTIYWPNSYYGRTFEEYNSDMFVKDFGLLKELATGVDKLTSRSLLVDELLPPGFRHRGLSVMEECMLTFRVIFLMLVKTLKLVIELPLLAIAVVAVNWYMYRNNLDLAYKFDKRQDLLRQDRTYDSPKRRIERIRLELVRQLRNEKDPIIKEELLDSIETLEILASGNTGRYIGDNVFDWAMGDFRRHKNYTVLGNLINDLNVLLHSFYNDRSKSLLEKENLEKRMEDLINNNLFVGLEQLRQAKK